MDGYGYAQSSGYSLRPGGDYPDHGDGFGEYHELGPISEEASKRERHAYTMAGGWQPPFECGGEPWGPTHPYWQWEPSVPPYGQPPQRPSRFKKKHRERRSRSRDTGSKSSRSRSVSRSRSRSKSRSKSRSRSSSHSRSHSGSRQLKLKYREPSLLDAFRVLYLTPSTHKKNSAKYLATKKKQDRIQELLKSDGLGSKRWLFYPRSHTQSEPIPEEQVERRESCDQRIKVDANFFRDYKKSKKIDTDAPIAKLKRWELILYKKLGFLQSV